MTITVKKKLTKEEKDKLFKFKKDRIKPIDMSKYKGKLKWKGNPLKLQKKWRDE